MNKFYNGKSRHIRLRHKIVKQMLNDGVIFLNFIRLEVNLADPLTKPLGRKLVYETSRGMELMPITKINDDGNPTYLIGKPNK